MGAFSSHLSAPKGIESDCCRFSTFDFSNKDCVMKTVFLLGRLIFGGFFLDNGFYHFQQKKAMAQYVVAKNVPMPDIAIPATGALLLRRRSQRPAWC